PSAKGDDKFITTDYLQQCPLTGEALLTAYEESEDSENLECESCRSEKGYYAHQRDKLEKQ
uniref:hypothetical protein n=1 Tax=Escherichia coli TaxID=562 RepID=UPI001BC83816